MTYHIPVNKPYRVTQKWGIKNKRYSSAGYAGHMGIDYAGQVAGVPQDVHASRAGTVVQSHSVAGWGGTIVIRHADGYETIYAHLSTRNVRVGQDVEDMQFLGMSGTTGSSTGVHLHFGLRPNKGHPDYRPNNGYRGWIDPTPYLSTKVVYTKFEMDNAKNALHNNSTLWDSTIDPKMRKQLENTNDMIRKKYGIEK